VNARKSKALRKAARKASVGMPYEQYEVVYKNVRAFTDLTGNVKPYYVHTIALVKNCEKSIYRELKKLSKKKGE
jgi:hypothetical protein